jgi:hypothetical protein
MQIESYAKSYILESSQSKTRFSDRKIIIQIMKYLQYFSVQSSEYEHRKRIVKSNAGKTNFQPWGNILTHSGKEKQKLLITK